MEIENENDVKNLLDMTEDVFTKMRKPEVRQVIDGSSMRYELFVRGKKLCSCDNNDSVREIESALQAEAKLMSLILTSMAAKPRSSDTHV